jgi:hypothetical protein
MEQRIVRKGSNFNSNSIIVAVEYLFTLKIIKSCIPNISIKKKKKGIV